MPAHRSKSTIPTRKTASVSPNRNWSSYLREYFSKSYYGKHRVDISSLVETETEIVSDHINVNTQHCSSKIHPLPPNITKSAVQKPYRRHRRPWSDDEFRALESGMQKYGANWVLILQDPEFASRLTGRTNVDLKDKARNERQARNRNRLDLGVFGDACVYW